MNELLVVLPVGDLLVLAQVGADGVVIVEDQLAADVALVNSFFTTFTLCCALYLPIRMSCTLIVWVLRWVRVNRSLQMAQVVTT